MVNTSPVCKIEGRGIKRTISISNTIKIMANKKNRVENGIRAVVFGSNPHSNGDDFSRSSVDREARTQAAPKIIIGTNSAMAEDRAVRIIN